MELGSRAETQDKRRVYQKDCGHFFRRIWVFFVCKIQGEKKQKSRMPSRFLDKTRYMMLSFPVRALGKTSLEGNNGYSFGN